MPSARSSVAGGPGRHPLVDRPSAPERLPRPLAGARRRALRDVPPVERRQHRAAHPRLRRRPSRCSATCAAAGVHVGVATSKRRASATQAMDMLGISQHVEVLVAMEDTERHKPDPTPLLLALERMGRSSNAAVYVGDAVVDVLAGKAAGMDTVAVTWGAGLPEALPRRAPDAPSPPPPTSCAPPSSAERVRVAPRAAASPAAAGPSICACTASTRTPTTSPSTRSSATPASGCSWTRSRSTAPRPRSTSGRRPARPSRRRASARRGRWSSSSTPWRRPACRPTTPATSPSSRARPTGGRGLRRRRRRLVDLRRLVDGGRRRGLRREPGAALDQRPRRPARVGRRRLRARRHGRQPVRARRGTAHGPG